MRKIYFLFVLACLWIAPSAWAQSSAELLGDYALETPGLNGTLKVRNAVNPDLQTETMFVFSPFGKPDGNFAFVLHDEIVDGQVFMKNENGSEPLPLKELIIRSYLDGNARFVSIGMDNGLDFLFRKL